MCGFAHAKFVSRSRALRLNSEATAAVRKEVGSGQGNRLGMSREQGLRVQTERWK